MEIRNIQPIQKIGEFKTEIGKMLRSLKLQGHLDIRGNSIRLSELRTEEKQFHTIPFEYSKNWYVALEKDKPVAINVHFKDMRQPIKRLRYLQLHNYYELNEALNLIADKLEISCKITSSFGLGRLVIRDGTKNTWLDNYTEMVYNASISLEAPCRKDIEQVTQTVKLLLQGQTRIA